MRLVIACALWGEWHTRVFQTKALPTLLHDSNLPAMDRKLDVRWMFFTPKQEVSRILPLVGQIGVKATIVPIGLQNGYKTAWGYAKYEAEKLDALVMFLAPDIVWSMGSLDHVADLILSGKRMVFMTHPRGIEDRFDGELRTGQGLMAIREKHQHPVNVAEVIENRPFTKHPEMVLWPIKGGYLVRMFAREPLICPPEMGFNEKNLPAVPMPDQEMAVVKSSDDACGISLAPLDTEEHHYKHGNVFRVEGLHGFLDHHKSSMGHWLASQPVIWRHGETEERNVWQVGKQSQMIVQQAFKKPLLGGATAGV